MAKTNIRNCGTGIAGLDEWNAAAYRSSVKIVIKIGLGYNDNTL
jgi:hypothetical protein